MIKNLVVHIGDPKSGSSSIQEALQTRAWQCDAVSIVPQIELNASDLAISLNKKGRKPEDYVCRFAEKRQWLRENEGDLGIISAEFFSASKPGMLQRALREELSDYGDTARVIAYVRPHLSRLLSGYGQRVKAGNVTCDFNTFVRLHGNERKFIYTPRFLRWQKVFGERFTLRPFIREAMVGQDVVTDFFHTVLQGAPFTVSPVLPANESLSLEELAGMRVVQSVLIERKVPDFLRMSLGNGIALELAAIPGRSVNRLQWDRGNAEIVSPSFRKDAKALDAAFFPDGLMLRSLDETLSKTVNVAQSMDSDTYFPRAAQIDLRKLAGQLADLVNKQPHTFWEDSKRRTGQYGYSERLAWGQIPEGNLSAMSASLFSRKKRNIAAVWKIIEQLCPVLVSGMETQ